MFAHLRPNSRKGLGKVGTCGERNWRGDWKIIERTEVKVQNRNGNDATYLGESAIDAAQRADEQLHVALGERRHVDVALLLSCLTLLVRHIENEDSFEC